MALTEFPKGAYKRLLRASKIIDNTKSHIAFQSILCGKPSTLYSYELGKNIDIGNSSYSLYDKLVSIMNDGEYSMPIHIYPISFYSIIRNTARLCTKNKKKGMKQKNKFSIFSNYCQDIVLSKDELMELVHNFESLANIARKQYQSTKMENIDPLTQQEQKNTFECDIIDWTEPYSDKELQAQIMNVLNNKHVPVKQSEKDGDKAKSTKKKPARISLEYSPKTLQSTSDGPAIWRNSLLFQHPLATMSRYNNIGCHDVQYYANDNAKIEPRILLGIFAQGTHPKLCLSTS